MGWFEKRVKIVGLKQMALAAVVLGGLGTWAAAEWRYLRNYFAGPIEMSAADLLAVKAPQTLDRYWILTKPDEIIDTGVDETTTTRRRRGGSSTSVTSHYYAFRYGDRLIFAQAEPGVKPEGRMEAAIERPSSTMPTPPAQLRDRFQPIMLNVKPFADSANWWLTIGGILGLGALGYGLRALMQTFSPTRHKAIAALAARPGFSLADAGKGIADDIAAKTAFKRKGHVVGGGYYAKTGGLSFDAKALDDLLWVYHEVTKKKIYWIIPAGSSHAMVLGFIDGPVTLPLKKGTAEGVMEMIAGRAPWALFGHSPEVAAAYTKQRRDLIAFVAGRKAELAAQRRA